MKGLQMNLEALEALAHEMGILIGFTDMPGLFIPPDAWPAGAFGENPPKKIRPVILLPESADREKRTLVLAHELGHASLGHRVGQKPRIVMEIEAWHWAKQALRGAH